MASSDASRKFGAVIRALREARGISLRGLADRVGISPSYLSLIEIGNDFAPPEEVIVKIAKEIGIGEAELLSLAGIVPSDVLSVYSRRPQLYVDLIRATRKLSNRRLEALTRAVREGFPPSGDSTFSFSA